MGLDMYLRAKKRMPREAAVVISKADPQKYPSWHNEWGEDAKTVQLVSDVGYWRKANAIHGWFVENVQDGEDDCEEYEVLPEQLAALRADCEEALERKGATEQLAPTEGFFFGDTSIRGLLEDAEHTIKIIDEVPKDWKIFYQSSW